MSNNRQLTKSECLTIAHGIAYGRDTITIAASLGVDRSTLSGWMRRDGFLETVAASLRGPDDLDADALECLRDDCPHEGERKSAWALRMAFWDVVRRAFPEYFEWERKELERLKREEERRRAKAAEEAKRERREEEARRKAAHECYRAGYFNLQTLCIVHARDWRDGTADELARGLATPEQRKAWRCKKGIEWTSPGFGPYFEKSWSANRCEMRYFEDGFDKPGDAFYATVDNPRFAQAWREIESRWDGERESRYIRDPFAFPRDERLPTTEAAAKALSEKVRGGADFLEAVGAAR